MSLQRLLFLALAVSLVVGQVGGSENVISTPDICLILLIDCRSIFPSMDF